MSRSHHTVKAPARVTLPVPGMMAMRRKTRIAPRGPLESSQRRRRRWRRRAGRVRGIPAAIAGAHGAAPALCVGRRLCRLRARRLIVAVRRPHCRRGARYSLWKRRTPGRPARAHSRALEFATVGVLGGRSRERAENVLPNHELLLLGRAVRSRSAAGARKRDATAQTAAQRGSAVT